MTFHILDVTSAYCPEQSAYDGRNCFDLTFQRLFMYLLDSLFGGMRAYDNSERAIALTFVKPLSSPSVTLNPFI
jgi:hypothetical protein